MKADASMDSGKTEPTRSSSEWIFEKRNIEQGRIVIDELKAKDFESV